MSQCLGCGRALAHRQKVYCGHQCYWAARIGAKIKRWLDTGEVHIAGHRSHFVRKCILDEQDGRCAICGLADVWENEQLVLVLDHIDGDATNNHRENLRMICPNCDSQLPTFKSRNRGNGRAYRRERYANGQTY